MLLSLRVDERTILRFTRTLRQSISSSKLLESKLILGFGLRLWAVSSVLSFVEGLLSSLLEEFGVEATGSFCGEAGSRRPPVHFLEFSCLDLQWYFGEQLTKTSSLSESLKVNEGRRDTERTAIFPDVPEGTFCASQGFDPAMKSKCFEVKQSVQLHKYFTIVS